jgi:WD40 repeat protein
MSDQLVATASSTPFDDAAEMRQVNSDLLQVMDRRLGGDSSAESEVAALRELESEIRGFLDRGAATGALVEDIKERTACQVLLDYWSSTLSHAGISAPRSRLAAFDAERLPDLDDDKCPYVGLESFRSGAFFFGRERAVDSLLQRVREVPLVVVQGGSGSGKSSLVMGGALPLLHAADGVSKFRTVGPFTPGNAVLENLVDALNASSPDARFDRVTEANALRENPGRLPEMLGAAAMTPALLVVDQFEEVFTLCNDGDRAAMAAAIDALLKSSPASRVILTLREEFTNELGKLEPLRPYVAQHARFSMKEWPMEYDELKAAVERPAALVNLHFAPGLVDDLVKSVLGQDTALPLLQFALQSLWKRRDHNRITREVYQKVGSPLVALERYAEGFYKALTPESREEVKRILLELVRIDRMMEAYREPRMRRALLESGNPRTPEMLDLLAREGFLRITPTLDGDATVEVRHEALLRNWPRYVGWIGGKREGVRQRVAMTEAAQRWDARGRSPTTDLLSPWQLHEAQHLTGLDQLEQDYVQASKDLADADRRARDRDKQLKYSIAAFGVVALFVMVGSLLWIVNANAARSRSQVLAFFAGATEASYRGQIDEAFRLALQAGLRMAALPDNDRDDLRPQLREVLLSTLQNAANLRRLFIKDESGGTFNAVAFHPTRPDQLVAFGGSDGRIYLTSLAGGGKSFPTSLETCSQDQGVSALAFEAQGRLLVVGCRSGKLAVWSADDWHPVGSTKVSPRFIRSLSIRRDGRLVAASGNARIALIELDEQGDPSRQLVTWSGGEEASAQVQSVAFSPTEDTLLAGDGDGYLLVCKPGSERAWDCNRPTDFKRTPNDAILTLAYSPDGSQVAVGHYWRGIVEIWDTQFSRPRMIYHQSLAAVYSLAFFESCGRWQLAIGTSSGLEFSPVAAGPEEAEPVQFCAKARWAQIGDHTYSVASDGRSGLLAAATLRGYVAVLDPGGGRHPQRVRVPASNRKPIRGAIVAEQGPTAWLALQGAPTEADPSNVVIFKLGEGHGDDVLHLASGKGEILRLAASRKTRRLATIGCARLAPADDCSSDDYEVTVWQFADRMDAPPTRIVSLASPDFTTPEFKDGVPLRAVLSPDGQWLAISFLARAAPNEKSRQPLLVLRLDDPGKRMWVPSDLSMIREIAFSEDSKMFAAGGCCTSTGVDQIRLWAVAKSEFTEKELALLLSPFARVVQDLAFATDQKGHSILLIGGRFGTISRWDLGQRTKDLQVDAHGTSFVAFNRDESLTATASAQGVIRLWHLKHWPPFALTPPTDDPGVPGFLEFVANGAWLVSSADKVDVWDVDPASLHRKMCALVRKVGPDGVDGDKPWQAGEECKEGALAPPPRSFLERARDFLGRMWVAIRFPSGTT